MTSPDKLPPIRGNSQISKAFRITWEKINQVIDYARSHEPRPTLNALTSKTTNGTTVVPIASSSETQTTGGGPARYA